MAEKLQYILELDSKNFTANIKKAEQAVNDSGNNMGGGFKNGTKQVEGFGKAIEEAGRRLHRAIGIGALVGAGVMAMRSLIKSIAEGSKSIQELQAAVDKGFKLGIQDEMTKVDSILKSSKGGVESLAYGIYKISSGIAIFVGYLMLVPNLIQSAGLIIGSFFEKIANNIRMAWDAVKNVLPGADKVSNNNEIAFLKDRNNILDQTISKERARNQQNGDYLGKIKTFDKFDKEFNQEKAGDIEKQNKAYEKQVSIVQDLGKKILGMLPKGSFDDTAKQITEVVDKLQEFQKQAAESKKSIVDVISSTASGAGAGGAIGAFVGLLAGMIGYTEAAKTAWEADRNLRNEQEKAASEEKYLNYINELRAALQALIDQTIKLQFIVDKESIIRNNTADDVDREIKAKKDLYDINQEIIKQAKANAGGADTSSYQDYYNQAAAIRKQIEGYGGSAEYWNRIADQLANSSPVASGQARDKANTYLSEYNRLEGQAKIYSSIADDLKTANGLELANLGLENDLTDLAQERLDIMKKQTDEMSNQLDQQIKLGLIDVQSYAGVGYIKQQLSLAGLTGLGLGTAAMNLGVNSADLGRGANVGQINITNYEANLNTMSGSIAAQIASRLG